MSDVIFLEGLAQGIGCAAGSAGRGKFLDMMKAFTHIFSVWHRSQSFSTRFKSSAIVRHRSGSGGLMGTGWPSTKHEGAPRNRFETGEVYGFTASDCQAIAAGA
ncbi:MAG TPA: hypothetical protein VIV84_04195 [Burkholderiaceae bacterium]